MKKSLVVLLAVLSLVACKDDTGPSPQDAADNGSGGKSDSFASCSADEPLLLCMTDNCQGLAGADFDDCFGANACDVAADDAPDDCSECVVNGFMDGLDADGIAVECTDSVIETGCEADEGVITCINAECSGLVGDAFDTCFEDNCEADATDTPVECGLCLVSGFEAGLDAAQITAACTNAEPAAQALSGVACGGDDLALFTCITDNCPDADTSEAVGECIADQCTTEAQETAIACVVCVDGHLSDPAASGTAEASCTAADSAPCAVSVATNLQQCADVACSGQQGDALDECMDTECPEVFDDVSEQCGTCVIGLNSRGVPFSEAAGHCAGG